MTATLAAYRELIDRALEHSSGTHTFDDIAANVDARLMQAWRGERAIVVSAILTNPRCLELHFFLAAGDIDEVLELEAEACGWGRVHGCTRASFIGRHGWQRHQGIKGAGWAPTHTVFMKDL